MTTTDGLLLAVVALLGFSIIRSEVRHHRLLRLLGDLATMLGDALDEITDQVGRGK